MAGTKGPPIEVDVASLAQKVGNDAETAQVPVSDLVESLDKLVQKLGEIADAPGFQKLANVAQKKAASIKKSTDDIISGKPVKDISSITSGFGEMGKAASETAENMLQGFLDSSSSTRKSMESMAGSAVGLMAQVGKVAFLEKLESKIPIFKKMQQPLLDMEKRGMQMGLSLGQSFTSSAGYLNKFRESLTATALDTNVMQEDITKVTAALGTAFIPKEATGNLDRLSDSIKNVDGSLNLVKTSILVGAATGMNYADVANIMSKAHLELGETVEGSAAILGNISLAAEKSGLTFGKVSESVMKAADSLKMWGGTVGAVTPIYSAFAGALGKGRKGLAPELFEQYISGLQGMQFEMKALIGMQAGGAGKGAIGAGLEMEALMAKGPEGMAEMSEKLIETIKQFSGGEMITAEEAIADPALERNFIMQRRLLQQMVGGSDASATQMMSILKDIEKSDMAIGEDQKKALGDMMGTGERVQDRATTILQNELINLEQVTLNASANIIGELGPLISVSFQKQIGAVRRFTEKVGKTGRVEMPQIDKLIESFTGKQGVSDIMSLLGFSGKEEREETKEGVERGQKDATEVMDALKEKLGQIKEDASAKGKKMSEDDIKSAFKEAIDALRGQRAEIEERGQEDGLSKIQSAHAKLLEQLEISLVVASSQPGGNVVGIPKRSDARPPVLDKMRAGKKEMPPVLPPVTREQAIADPALERDFLMQRALSKQKAREARESVNLASPPPSELPTGQVIGSKAGQTTSEARTVPTEQEKVVTINAKLSEDSRSIQISIEPFMKNVREAAREEARGVLGEKQ